jgi:hypothetical protein
MDLAGLCLIQQLVPLWMVLWRKLQGSHFVDGSPSLMHICCCHHSLSGLGCFHGVGAVQRQLNRLPMDGKTATAETFGYQSTSSLQQPHASVDHAQALYPPTLSSGTVIPQVFPLPWSAHSTSQNTGTLPTPFQRRNNEVIVQCVISGCTVVNSIVWVDIILGFLVTDLHSERTYWVSELVIPHCWLLSHLEPLTSVPPQPYACQMSLLVALFFPTQGFFNFIVFIRPRPREEAAVGIGVCCVEPIVTGA